MASWTIWFWGTGGDRDSRNQNAGQKCTKKISKALFIKIQYTAGRHDCRTYKHILSQWVSYQKYEFQKSFKYKIQFIHIAKIKFTSA